MKTSIGLEKFVKGCFVLVYIGAILSFAATIALICVAVHFIAKFW